MDSFSSGDKGHRQACFYKLGVGVMKIVRVIGVSLVILGLAVFGGSQFFTRKAYQQQLEAGYQRAFRELTVHINGLEAELAKLQVANSRERKLDCLGNVLRLIYAAQANLGQLPVSGLNLSRIENLLAKIQTRSVQVVRNGNGNQLKEVQNQFTGLYQQVKFLNGELQTELNAKESSTSWVNWKQYFQTSIIRSSNVEPGARYPLMQSLVMIENGMDRFADSDFTGELEPLQGPIPSGPPITQEEAVEIARVFLQELAAGRSLRVSNKTEGELAGYTVEAIGLKQDPIIIEISANGGRVLWMTNPRIVTASKLSVEQLLGSANEFLMKRGFLQAELTDVDRMQNRLMLSFVVVQDNVLIYPQQFKVQVACDNGEILGFHGLAYHSFQRERELAPAFTAEQAKEYVSNIVTIVDQRLALILDESFQEVLTYQFRVNHGEEQFLVYINADQGNEEKIIRVGS